MLKDKICLLKGEKKRPTFKPSCLDQETGTSRKNAAEAKAKKRPGSHKRSKNVQLANHEDQVINQQRTIPSGSRFRGYRDFVIREPVIRTQSIRYRLERWKTPIGQTLTAQLPGEVGGHHYRPHLRGYILYQHRHYQNTQPLLVEQLREWGVDISRGETNHL